MNSMKLIFVYNADNDFGSKLKDFAVKTFTPNKYQCQLCMVTHGVLSEKKEWRDFLSQAGFEARFLHRNEFLKQYRKYADIALPAVFEEGSSGGLRPIMTGPDFGEIQSISGLIEWLKAL
jgi:hypothetical protein